MATLTTLVMQVAVIRFSRDGFHIVQTTQGESVAGKFNAQLGYCYTCEGVWDETSEKARQYGPTFKLESAVSVPMTTPNAIGRFLTLRLKGKGVGETVIGTLVDACETDGLDLVQLLDRGQRDTLIECVGKRNAKKMDVLLDLWPSLKPQADLFSPLLGYGLSEAMAENLVSLYGKNAVKIVENDPYGLILTLDGVSFLTADRIAMKVGRISIKDPIRIHAAFSTGIREATTNGDIGVRRKTLIDKTSVLVNEAVMENGRRKLAPGVAPAIPSSELGEMLDTIIKGDYSDKEGKLCKFASRLVEAPDEKGEMVIWYKPLLEDEQTIADRIAAFNAPPRLDLAGRVSEFATRLGIKELAPAQHDSVEMVMKNPISIITGGPGRGKSFVLKVILAAFDAAGLKGDLAAPTGKAAKRITESTGRIAQTLHSLIGYTGAGTCGFDQNTPLLSDYLVIDESSMVDTELMAATLSAVKDSCRIIVVGDVDQLPSVGPGQVLRDLIRSDVLPMTRLKKGWRFSGGISEAASAINRGELPETSEDGQFEFIDTMEPAQELMKKMEELLADGVNVDDIQVLSPTNRGGAGCESLNAVIQSHINPEPKGGTNQRLRRESGDIRVGDRVIQTKNNRELKIVNGDLGWIDDINSDKGNVTLSLPDRPLPLLIPSNLTSHLKLAYAITIHKSQGAEAPYILLALDSASAFMIRRSLVYTGVTRGSKKVIVFATRNLLSRGVRIGEPPEGSRRTTLAIKLREKFVGHSAVMKTASPPDLLASAMLLDEQDILF